MKYLIIIMMLLSAYCFAQSDGVLNDFTSGDAVNSALLKAVQAVTGSGTNNQLVYWTGANTIGALSTFQYPSLTELRYVKGVTSAIQSQLNNKQASLVSGNNIKTINGISLLGSGNIVLSMDTTGLRQLIRDAIAQELEGISIIGNAATLDSMITDFRKGTSVKLKR